MCPVAAAGLEVWSFQVVEIRPYLVREIYCLAISFTPLVSCPDNTRKRKGLVAFATFLGAVCKIRKEISHITEVLIMRSTIVSFQTTPFAFSGLYVKLERNFAESRT